MIFRGIMYTWTQEFYSWLHAEYAALKTIVYLTGRTGTALSVLLSNYMTMEIETMKY